MLEPIARLKHTEEAVVKARKARRKKWIWYVFERARACLAKPVLMSPWCLQLLDPCDHHLCHRCSRKLYFFQP